MNDLKYIHELEILWKQDNLTDIEKLHVLWLMDAYLFHRAGYTIESSFDTKTGLFSCTVCRIIENKVSLKRIPCCGIISADFLLVTASLKRKMAALCQNI
jgi:hypothetical protein